MSKLPTLLVPGKVKTPEGVGKPPVEYILNWVRRRMPEFGGQGGALADRVLVVRSETGSGKSTVLPVYLFRILRAKETPAAMPFRGAGLVCTQPRVLTAIALAADVSSVRSPWNPDMVLGAVVGFQTGPVSNRPPAGLVYATAGVLAAQLGQQEDAELMARYRFIIVDEAHERSLESDATLMLLRHFYARNAGNPRLPFLLLTSATFDPRRYAAYFGVGEANIVEVEGRAYPITTHWPERGTNDYPAAAAAAVVRIHEENAADPPERADILVFVPGADGAERVREELDRANRKYARREGEGEGDGDGEGEGPPPFLLLVINREVVVSQAGDYALVFEAPGRLPRVGGRQPGRRVIISTVVAETGLTIDTLRYVVDCGWNRAREVYQPWGAEGLVTRPAPRSRVEQRKGRAGRLFPGDFYPLYTENVYKALDPQQLPDIVTVGYDRLHLVAVREQQRQKLRLGERPEFRVEDLSLLDPPPAEAFLAASAAAAAHGFVSARAPLPGRWPPDPLAEREGGDRGYGLTALGHVAALFARTPPEGVRVLLAGYVWGAAAADLATAVAMFGTAAADLLDPKERRRREGLPPGAAALREALPPYLAARTGGAERALPPAESEAAYYRARLLIADDFAEAVLVFDAFARRLDGAGGAPGPVAAWCREAGLSYDGLLKLARAREGVLEEMVVAGLDPFRASDRRLAALPAEAFTDGVARLKRCLYDGLRARLLRLDPAAACYRTRQGLRVKAPDLLADAAASRLRALGVARRDARPRWLLTDVVRLAALPPQEGEKAPPILYAAAANLVSVLDGYVDVDPELDGPRAFAAENGAPE